MGLYGPNYYFTHIVLTSLMIFWRNVNICTVWRFRVTKTTDQQISITVDDTMFHTRLRITTTYTKQQKRKDLNLKPWRDRDEETQRSVMASQRYSTERLVSLIQSPSLVESPLLRFSFFFKYSSISLFSPILNSLFTCFHFWMRLFNLWRLSNFLLKIGIEIWVLDSYVIVIRKSSPFLDFSFESWILVFQRRSVMAYQCFVGCWENLNQSKDLYQLKHSNFKFFGLNCIVVFLLLLQGRVKKLDLYGKLNGHEGCVNAVEFNSTGDVLVSGSDDRQIMLWNWLSGSRKLSYPSGHCENVFQTKFIPFTDDRTIITSGADGQVIL